MSNSAKNNFLLHVPESTILGAPVEIFHSENKKRSHIDVSHRIILESNSEAALLEYFEASNDVNASNDTTSQHLKIVLRKGAKLNHYRIQNEGSNISHETLTHVEVEKDACYRAFQFDLGAKTAKTTLKVDLLKEGACADLNGLYLLNDEQVVENDVLVSHHVSQGKSRQVYKGILQGASEGAFTGKVLVHKNAQHTQADQVNHNILLSEHAKVNFKPELEIYADDVNCTHGATVGQLDEKAVFYFQSRGIDKKTAQRMLLKGFADDVLSAISNEAVLKKIKPVIDKRIASLL